MSESKGRSWPRSRRIVNAVNPFPAVPNALDRGARRHFCLDQLVGFISVSHATTGATPRRRRLLPIQSPVKQGRFWGSSFGNLCDYGGSPALAGPIAKPGESPMDLRRSALEEIMISLIRWCASLREINGSFLESRD
jgi:hypothetical protein